MVLLVGGILIYSQVGVMGAEPEPLSDAQTNPGLTITADGSGIVLSPTSGATGQGLVFIPGAKVAAEGYIATFADTVVDDGVTVVITKPWLNLAFFDPRPLSTFTDLAPTCRPGRSAVTPSAACGPASWHPTPMPSCCSPRTARTTSRHPVCPF